MKKIVYLLIILFVPCLGYAQNSLTNISGLSELASNSPLSLKQLVSGIYNFDGTLNLTPLINYSSTINHYKSGIRLNASLSGNFSNLTDKNTAIVLQNGSNNIAQVNQSGSANVAVLQQAGNNINNSITQVGNKNVYGSVLIGNNHQLEVSQIGNNNLYLLEYNSSKTLNHTVQQIGNNLKTVQIGKTAKPYSVKQFGTGMNIIIHHYQY